MPKGQVFSQVQVESWKAKILEIMQRTDQPPFFALAAEQAGVNRKTATNWLLHGDQGGPHQPWSLQIRAARSKYMSRLAAELLDPGISSAARSAREFMLGRLDRDLFDPPKQIHDKVGKAATAGDAPPPPDTVVAAEASASLEEPELDDAGGLH